MKFISQCENYFLFWSVIGKRERYAGRPLTDVPDFHNVSSSTLETSVILNPWQRSVGKRDLAFNEVIHVRSQAKLSKYQGT